jgi:hypothetical protein
LVKNFKGYHVKNRSLRRRHSGVPQPHILMSRIVGFRKPFNLFLSIFPHMAVERERKPAERAGEYCPFCQSGYGVISDTSTDRACKGERLFFHGSIANAARAPFTCLGFSNWMVCMPSF